MDSQILVEELERLKAGQPGAESRVLFVLSRSSLFLLAADGVADDGAAQVTVKVRLLDVHGRRTAYLFSSEVALNEWCLKSGFQPNALPIHGGDVEFLLPKETWMVLDPDTAHATLLSPDQLALVNQDQTATMSVMAGPKADDGFVSVVPKEELRADAPNVYQPVGLEPAIPDGPVKRKFAPKTHPTTLFQAPNVERNDIQKPRERTYTSSNLRKVIRSLKDEEGGGEE